MFVVLMNLKSVFIVYCFVIIITNSVRYKVKYNIKSEKINKVPS